MCVTPDGGLLAAEKTKQGKGPFRPRDGAWRGVGGALESGFFGGAKGGALQERMGLAIWGARSGTGP